MEIINISPFQFASIVGRIGYPKHSLTLIVKGTFDLIVNNKVIPSDEQIFTTGEELYSDDEEGTGSTRYESDFAYYKPHADLLLVGKCYAPNGKPTQACRVTYQVGTNATSLAVIGNRYWKSAFAAASDPEPFTEMELRYENSYGGDAYNKNPVGKGYKKESEVELWQLPNIENIEHRINSPDDNPDPAGFGPLGKMWHERFSKMGTYKGTWLKERWPWFPKEFDWSHFNAAPPDMQVKGYLKGDEALFFENLHPVHSNYHSQLPGLRIRLFVNEFKNNTLNETRFKEVAMNLDTFWVDMEAEKLVLNWRGITSVRSEDYEEIQHIFIATEKLDETAQSVDYFYDLFLKKLAEEEAEYSDEKKPLELAEVEDTSEVDEELVKAEAQMKAAMVKAGIDPDNPPVPTPEQLAEEARILNELGYEELEEQALTRESFMERVRKGEEFIGEHLRDIDLSGLDIKGANLKSAIMSGLCLKNADLSYAILSEVNLSRADLSNANLTGVNLKDADLTGANLSGADLTGSFLEDAIFEKACLHDAVLDEASALNTNFSEANLANATLINSTLKGADFSRCNLERANMQGANLCEASLEGVSGKEVNMTEANLTEICASDGCDFSYGHFGQAKGKESIWEGAKLTNSDFSCSSMEGADFTSADLTSANFSAADMRYARFSKANLQEAKLIQMNLFQGSLEKANLTRTDFSGSNLYGVEFLDAIIEKTEFGLSNLKMTKLSRE